MLTIALLTRIARMPHLWHAVVNGDLVGSTAHTEGALG